MRIQSPDAAKMLGLTVRGVQAMAARGDLPGAAKIGKVWTFDKEKLRRFVEAMEAKCASETYSKEKASGGCEPPCAAVKSEKAYELAISKLRGGDETRGSKKSKRRDTSASGAGHGSRP